MIKVFTIHKKFAPFNVREPQQSLNLVELADHATKKKLLFQQLKQPILEITLSTR